MRTCLKSHFRARLGQTKAIKMTSMASQQEDDVARFLAKIASRSGEALITDLARTVLGLTGGDVHAAVRAFEAGTGRREAGSGAGGAGGSGGSGGSGVSGVSGASGVSGGSGGDDLAALASTAAVGQPGDVGCVGASKSK